MGDRYEAVTDLRPPLPKTAGIRHIFAAGMKVATVDGGQTHFHHPDHLSGANVDTDESGSVAQLTDYFPYGGTRLDERAGDYENLFRFTGKELDEGTGLYYYGARYYDPFLGRFISADPATLAVGDENEIRRITNLSLREYLSDPQHLNGHSYAGNNPLKYTDPTGQFLLMVTADPTAVQSPNVEFGQAYDPAPMSEADRLAIAAVGSLATAGMIEAFPILESVKDTVQTLFGAEKSIQNGVKTGDSFGKLGTVVENTSQKITGYTSHGLDQKISREVSTSKLIDAAKNPVVTLQQVGNTTLRLTRDVGLVLNQAGKVVTTYAKEQFLPHVKSLIEKITK